jgi:hypothetical protein
MDIGRDIEEIGQLILSAAFIQEVREEVAAVMRDGFVVTDGEHHPMGEGYDVVVRCGSEDRPDVFRRIRGKIPDAQVEKIADGVLGIKASRRMRGVRGI